MCSEGDTQKGQKTPSGIRDIQLDHLGLFSSDW